MGIQIDHDKPYTPEIKAYLVERGRDYLIPANERRFGEDGTRVPEPHESTSAPSVTPFYSTEAQQRAVYDVGGAPLPGTVLDYNTGRVADRDDGVLVEYTGPGHTPGAYDIDPDPVDNSEGFNSQPEEDDIDDDIVSFVQAVKTKVILQEKLAYFGVGYESDANRARLEEILAITLQDLRDDGTPIDLS
jgi:hypothetical protein